MRPGAGVEAGDMSGAQNGVGAVLIAGPTASGKSALALALAERIGGAIVNADSMQVYGDLRIITARPTPAEDARAALDEVRRSGRVAIFVGGTGLYFKALTAGIAAVPPIPPDIRDGVRARLAENGAAALHTELARRDPAGAARLNRNDRTRIARALEVVEATGRPLV